MKRGQVTMFIIVGIVILMVLALTVTAWRIINKEKPPEPVITKEVNVELKPLLNYIDNCLKQVGYESVQNIGLHGGYNDPLAAGIIAIPGRPTESDAFEPFAGMVVPYWSYMSSANDCTNCYVSSEQPPLNGRGSIHDEIAKSVDELLPICLNNFAGLENRYTITQEGIPTTSVEINDQSITIKMDQKLTVVTDTGSVTELNDFSADIEVPLGRLYAMADSIRRTAEGSKYFEGLTMETITLESAGDPEPIPPPFGDTELSWDPGPFWMLQKTKDIVSSALENNIGIVQLWGSKDMNFVYTDNESYNSQYANYYFTAPGTDPNVKASFMYFSTWDSYMKIRPGSQLIKPDVISSALVFVPPLKRKVFSYDVSYPILVQLRAPTDKGDYLFQFGIEVNVRNNNPIYFDPLSRPEPDITYCDPIYWNAGTVTASVVDGQGMPLRAEVYYDCVQESCFVRKTAGNGLMTAQLPACVNGKLRAEKFGYRGAPVPLDSEEGQETEQQIVLYKLKPVDVTLREHQVVKVSKNRWQVGANEFDVPAEHKMVTIFRSRTVPEHVQVFTGGSGTIELFPDTYDITVVGTGTMYEPIYIPEKVYPEECGLEVAGVCVAGHVPEHTIPAITIGGNVCDPTSYECTNTDEMYIGGLEWDDSKNVLITQDMIDSGQLYVPAIIIPAASWFFTEHDDLSVYDQLKPLSNSLDIRW